MGKVWDLAKLGFDPIAPWSLCHGRWRVGSLLISKHLRQSPTHRDSCLPGLFLQLPWDHLEGHFHPQFWLPWLSTYLHTQVSFLQCFCFTFSQTFGLFSVSKCDRFCEAETPGSRRRATP